MEEPTLPLANSHNVIEELRKELEELNPNLRQRAMEKFALAALGSIPWVGGFLSALANLKTEEGTLKTDLLQTRWLDEHQRKMDRLGGVLTEIASRFESIGNEIDERIKKEEYLDIVRKAFRAWDNADTDQKRQYAANLIVNSAGTRVCSEDVVRLFIDWLDLYHESHFTVIQQIFKEPGITRYEIWINLYGDTPREDSAEADLYKLIIHDLSVGRVIRQPRETTEEGRYLIKKPLPKKLARSPTTVESAFEETKPYVLTELGKQFVHYTMNEVVTRIDEPAS